MKSNRPETEERKDNKETENIADLPVDQEQADQAKGGGSRNGNLQITQFSGAE